MKINNKGMTLVEIIVALVISSLVIIVAGTYLLDGFGYFNKTTVADSDKYAVDSIAKLVRDELVFSTDVRIEKSKPYGDGWHVISVSGDSEADKSNVGRLQKDDKFLFENGFYQNRKLVIMAKQFENGYRLDLNFSFIEENEDKEDKKIYETSSTLELMNLESSLTNNNTKYDEVDISKEYKIYYRTGATRNADEGNTNSEDYTGTVNDEENCRTKDNTFTWAEGKNYSKGSFVYYTADGKGTWYRAVTDITSADKDKDIPNVNKNGNWKSLSVVWQQKSSYEKGDVVKYSSFYYQCVDGYKYDGKILADKETSEFQPGMHLGKHWNKLSKEEYDYILKEHKDNKFCAVKTDKITGTVADEIKCKDSIITPVGDTHSNNKGVWLKDVWVTQGKLYSYGDFVQYPDEDGIWYRLRQPTDDGANNPKDSLSWKIIDANFDSKSYYEYKDIVFYNGKYWQMIRKFGGASDASPGDPASYFVWDGPKNSPSEFIIPDSEVDMTPEYFSCNISTSTGKVDNKDDHLTFEEIEIYEGNGYGNIGKFVRYDNYVWLTVQSGKGNI